MRSPDRKNPVKRRLDMQLELLEKRVMMNAASFIAVPNVSFFYAPAQMQTAYTVNQLSAALPGKGETVAIVDAFNDPTALNDVNTFSSEMGLPLMDGVGNHPTLSISTPTGQAAPANNTGWDEEIGLDVEWVHSIAPYANIDLVECQNNSGDSLFAAEVDGQPYQSGEYYAQRLPGVVAVTNSYGGGEFGGETAYDGEFSSVPGVVITVSTGDSGANGEYPAYSPNVLAIGGTSLFTISGRGRYGTESGWSGSGGGISAGGEATPAFQSNNGVNFGARSIPDVSMDADPSTGAIVYYSFPGLAAGNYGIGGTSLSSPMWAGVIALADQARAANGLPALSTSDAHNAFYGLYGAGVAYSGGYFHDIKTGNNGFAAGVGYDLVTGIGSPIAVNVVTYLSTYGAAAAAVTPIGGNLGSPGSGGGAVGASLASASVLPSATAPAGTSAPVTFQAARAEALQSITPSNVVTNAPVASRGQLLFPTATVVAAEMGQNVLVDTNSAAPAGAVSATARTDAIAPAAPSSAAVVDRIFSNESTLLTSDGHLGDSAPLVNFEDSGPVDLAVAAGLALAVSGSWGGMEPWDAERKQVTVTR
jgi:subtilase family serine protease